MESNYCEFCGINSLVYVRYIMANGVINVRQQCDCCGLLKTYNFKRKLFDFYNLPFMDIKKREQFNERRKEKKPKDYYQNVYLKSYEWSNKRNEVLKRDNNKCVCCSGNATQVHHITYNDVYREKLEQLISVCKECHAKIHFDGVVYFRGLKANYGKLMLCHSCNQYNDDNQSFCKQCETRLNIQRI
jgi:5-methylcytosine-specific restriction endonuclease McrA